MKLKAYKVTTTCYVLRVSITSDILSPEELSNFIGLLDFLNLKEDFCLLTYKESKNPVINVDEVITERMNFLFNSFMTDLFIIRIPFLIEFVL